MVNQKEHMHTLLKSALEAIEKAEIQRAVDLLNNACMALEGWQKEEEWSVGRPWQEVQRPNDALLKEFGW